MRRKHSNAMTRTCVAYGLAILVAWPAEAQQPMPPSKIQQLMMKKLPEMPGRETQVITIDIPPGGGSPAHRHPGHHIFGYVLEGEYRFKVDAEPEVVLKKGDTFHEPPGALHAVSRNASTTEPAKLMVVIVAESGKPITVPEKQ